MRIDFSPAESWQALNSELRRILGLPDNHVVRIYPGVAAALFEATLGLQQFFPHKKKYGRLPGTGPTCEFLLPHLLRDEGQILAPGPAGTVFEWQQTLTGECNFVLSTEDNPVTGALDPNWSGNSSELADHILKAKIFSISVSHNLWRRELKAGALQLNPYSVRVLSVSPHVAVLAAGPRFRCLPFFAEETQWTGAESQVLQALVSSYQEDAALIESFESQLPAPWQPLLATKKRLNDRAVIFNPEINAAAVVDELMQQGLVDVLSLAACGWNTRPDFLKWWQPLPNPEILRGSLVLGLPALQSQALRPLLAASSNQFAIRKQWQVT